MQIIFIIVSAVTLFAGIMVVTNRNLFHAALYMMLSFLGVAGLYLLLDAGFMAATQLLVYIGAISILVIFAIMMTRRLMQTTETPYNSQWLWAGMASVALFALLVMVITQVTAVLPSDPNAFMAPSAINDPLLYNALSNMVISLGEGFVSPEQYVLPFILSSILLLVALVGAIIVARPDVEEDEL
jgi:NADH:ubiquinone oxidoreductase subunit 6 (subunit J)